MPDGTRARHEMRSQAGTCRSPFRAEPADRRPSSDCRSPKAVRRLRQKDRPVNQGVVSGRGRRSLDSSSITTSGRSRARRGGDCPSARSTSAFSSSASRASAPTSRISRLRARFEARHPARARPAGAASTSIEGRPATRSPRSVADDTFSVYATLHGPFFAARGRRARVQRRSTFTPCTKRGGRSSTS